MMTVMRVVAEDSEVPQEALIDRFILDQLRGEVQKLKMYKKMHEVPSYLLKRTKFQ